MNFFHRKGEVPFFTSLSSQSFANLFDRLFLVIVSLILLTFQSFAQSDDWTLSAEKGGVKIYHKVSTCNTQPVALLKFVNDNPDSVNVEWDAYTTFDSIADEMKLNDKPFMIKISAGTTESEDCSTELVQLVTYPNRYYFIKNMMTADTTQHPVMPKMDISNFRVDGLKVVQN